jgi:hypothetical protein
MKNKYYLLFVCLSLLIVCFFTSRKDGDVKVVSKIPEGFVSLTELNNRADSILDYVFWESQISFVDTPARICIYQTYVGNRDFIVKYKGEYYVNEAKYLELIDVTVLAQEERKRTYSLGDTVEILSANKKYYVTITGVEETALNNNRIFDIKFTATPDTTMEELKSIFSFAELAIGTGKGTGDLSNFVDAETIRLELKPDRRFDTIVLKSPEYPGLTYRVVVDE